MVTLLLLFTKETNFNLSGVQYQFDQENMLMTIEERFWDKQVVERQVTAQEALEIMLPINEAKRLWGLNIYLISLFAAVFMALFFTSLKHKKYFKWYVLLYLILLLSFIFWDVAQHQAIVKTLLS
jgi:hypothetical protein